MSKKHAARSQVHVTGSAIETTEQRRNLGRHIDAIVGGESFRTGIVRAQAEMLRKARAQQRDAHLAAYREYQTLVKDGRVPANKQELDRYVALREKFEQGGYTAYAVPGPADVHIDEALTNILIDEPAGELIGDLVLPMLPVDRRTNVIRAPDRSHYTQTAWDVTRAPGEPAKTGSYAYGSNVSYSVENRAMGFPVPDESQSNADAPLDPARDAMRIAEGIVRLKREVAVMTLVTTSTTYPSAHRLTTTTKWDNADVTNVEPRNDVQTLHNLIRKACGKVANRILVNFPTAQALTRLDDYRDRFKYVKEITDSVLMAELAAYFNVEQALIGMAVYNSAAPGQTATFTDVWPDDAVLFRTEPPSLEFSALGFSFCTDPGTVIRWRDADPSARTDKAAFELDCDEKVVNSNAGGHIDDVLT